ncbi:heavy metal translocating P-type ATPase [uncultured Helcococcus sp.]|uniref:heavy metal translocating P-type ATPase n=1 Tax=uncultured Helcococcus sp. TaxID=1072508 RepID=UPI002889A507|nr:heavy metal translocating P-type ATPase [uncultured Helcococcus sp.]
MKQKLDIEGMTCANCQLTVENAVKKLGAEKVNVSLLTNMMEVESDLKEEDIIKAVSDAGYKAVSKNAENKKNKAKSPKEIYDKQKNDMKKRLKVSIPFMVLLMYVAMGDMVNLPTPNVLKGYEGAGLFAFVQLLLSLPILYVNRRYFQIGLKALYKKHPNMDSLVAIGSGAAYVYGIYAIIMINYGLGIGSNDIVMEYVHDLYFEAGAMILTLITLGKYLEVRSKSKTSDAINKLIEIQEDTVTIVVDGVEKIIDVEDLKIGDIVKIFPGEVIGVDGLLVKGASSVDTSAITGESMPVEVNEGDELIAGSVNTTGTFLMEAKKVGNDTTVSKIIELMEEASASKAPISQMADKVSYIFVPTVISISIISFIVWLLVGASFTFAFSIAIGVLVISCPCALGLATPVAMMVANGKAAENGILVKNSESLEILNKIDTIVFDKTGTITQGDPALKDIVLLSDSNLEETLQIAKSLEANSQHPLALAILKYADEKSITSIENDNFDSITGMGVKGEIKGQKYYIGNDKLLKEYGDLSYEGLNKVLNIASDYSKENKTTVFLFTGGEVLAILTILDPIKTSSVQAIKDIEAMGIKTVMLTGDNEDTAKAISEEVNIDEYKAGLLPQDKDDIIQDLQKDNKLVAMVGDGINDAPSLMRSDVGIAIGAGTDVAIESADLVLIKSNLQDIVSAIKLSKKTIRNIKENLFWAFIYNIISIPLAMGVFYPSFGIKLNPMVGAFAMTMSSLFVVGNSLRLNNFKIDNKINRDEDIDRSEVNIEEININNTDNSQTKEEEGNNMNNVLIKIDGMSCLHCKKTVENILFDYDDNAEVSLEDKSARLKKTKDFDQEKIVKAIEDAGYKVLSVEDESR